MPAIPPGDVLFLALSVAAAPIGAAWLIRERRSHQGLRRQGGSGANGPDQLASTSTKAPVGAVRPSASRVS
jgi:hypothetical protein